MHLDVLNLGRCTLVNLRTVLCVSLFLLYSVAVTSAQCISGAYMATLPDGTQDCKLCQICAPDHRMVRKCASNHDATCCPPRTYTPLSSTKCITCSICSPGHYLKQECQVDSDTVCEPCPHQMFADTNDSLSCTPCKTCDPQTPCTSVSDTVCKEDSMSRAATVGIVAAFVSILSIVIGIVVVLNKKRREHSQTDSNTVRYDNAEVSRPDDGDGLVSLSNNRKTEISKPVETTAKVENENTTTADISNKRNISEVNNVKKGNGSVKRQCLDKTVGDITNPSSQIKKEPELAQASDALFNYTIVAIGVLVDSYNKNEWVASRVGTKYALTVSDAYIQIKEERKRRNREQEKMEGVHLFFKSHGTFTAFIFKHEPVYINHELHVMVLEVFDLHGLPTSLQLNTKPMIEKCEEVRIITCSLDQPSYHNVKTVNILDIEKTKQIKQNKVKKFENFVLLENNDVESFNLGSPGFGNIDIDTPKMDFLYTNISLQELEDLSLDCAKQNLIEEDKFTVCTSLHAVYNNMLKNNEKQLAENMFLPKF